MSIKWVRNRATGSYSSEDNRWVIHKTSKGWELEDLKSKSKYECNTLKESQQKCEELIKYYKDYSKSIEDSKKYKEQLKGTKPLKDKYTSKTLATKENKSEASPLVKVNVNKIDTNSHILKVPGANSKDNKSSILSRNIQKFSSVEATKLK